jgi:hypothetical protein
MSKTQHAVTLLELLLDIRSNFFNVAGIVESNNRTLVRTLINVLPVRMVQGHGYSLNFYETFFGLGDRSISGHLGLPRALKMTTALCLTIALSCQMIPMSIFPPVERQLWTILEEPLQPKTTGS